ncbi:MAG TPA: YggT family protein [Anaerolineaceae bacterium]|jgi:YggT family protein|nr:YggT family protein [Anaerolineales bacterium]HOG57973.1 YggT family protein [Anaerolineaceae bacterium]HOR83817.1 YggT family protein [Anaerolineaceae bacterium]HPL42659.1 YggT family protein [Anaerolineaceae bacterium]HPY32765.1 YggT family protein [Anaerolineaceae bacterium]
MTAALSIIRIAGQFLSLLVILHTIAGYFMPWDHPLRRLLDKIISPLLKPVQGLIKPVGGVDFSPAVLILLIYLLERLLTLAVRAVFR